MRRGAPAWRLEGSTGFLQVLLVSLLVVFFFPAKSGLAQESPTFAESVFVRSPDRDDPNRRVLDVCARNFTQPLLNSGAFIERQSAEVARMVSECLEETASPSFTQQCDLATAQSQVDLIILLSAEETGSGWIFDARAMSPLIAGSVWGDDILTDERDGVVAAMQACESLGNSLLRVRAPNLATASTPDSGRPRTVAPSVGRLEIMDVSPQPVAVYVDGREVGTAPGQFLDLPLGEVEMTLRAPGYEDLTRRFTLTDDEMIELHDLRLEALPATLAVTCNVEGADVLVDGQAVGETRGGGTVFFAVEAGARSIRVARHGYESFEEIVSLAAGSRSALEVDLELEVVEPATRIRARTEPEWNGLDLEWEVVEPATAVPTSTGAPGGFVLIRGGTFTMGSPSDEPGRDEDEAQHEVALTRDFYLQTHEVTQGEWRALMGNNPSHFSSCGAECPVEMINWYEALAYANARSSLEGLNECYSLSACSNDAGEEMECSDVTFAGLDCEGYRLPTEAEWEYAARAGTTTAWYCGSTNSCVSRMAWYSGNSASRSHRVGEKTPNELGLYDMSGNVWEWVWDRYDDYGSRSVVDPVGETNGDTRAYRGGCWANDAHYLRSASRGGGASGRCSRRLGFRLARSVR